MSAMDDKAQKVAAQEKAQAEVRAAAARARRDAKAGHVRAGRKPSRLEQLCEVQGHTGRPAWTKREKVIPPRAPTRKPDTPVSKAKYDAHHYAGKVAQELANRVPSNRWGGNRHTVLVAATDPRTGELGYAASLACSAEEALNALGLLVHAVNGCLARGEFPIQARLQMEPKDARPRANSETGRNSTWTARYGEEPT